MTSALTSGDTVLLTATSTSYRFSRTAWLLTLSPLPFVAWLAAVVATMSGSGVSDTADLTPAQMEPIRTGFLLMWPIYTAAIVFGAIAMFGLRTVGGRLAIAAGVVSIMAAVAHLVLIETAAGFTEARLGLNDAYLASQVASYTTIWAAMVAIILTGVGLYRTGILRRTGLTVAVLAGVLLILDVLTRGLPPFIVAFFWLAVGIGLLRRRVASPA